VGPRSTRILVVLSFAENGALRVGEFFFAAGLECGCVDEKPGWGLAFWGVVVLGCAV
jgi:hypothetical protein